MANVIYDKGRQAFLEGQIAYLTDTIKVALVKSTYTPSTSLHQFYSDVSSHVAGTPLTLSGKTSTGGVADADDLIFPTIPSGFLVKYLVIYKDTGTDSTSPLIGVIDSGTNIPTVSNGAEITVSWSNDSNKIFKL